MQHPSHCLALQALQTMKVALWMQTEKTMVSATLRDANPRWRVTLACGQRPSKMKPARGSRHRAVPSAAELRSTTKTSSTRTPHRPLRTSALAFGGSKIRTCLNSTDKALQGSWSSAKWVKKPFQRGKSRSTEPACKRLCRPDRPSVRPIAD